MINICLFTANAKIGLTFDELVRVVKNDGIAIEENYSS